MKGECASGFIRAMTDFIFVEDAPMPSDLIVVPGSSHPEHVLHAAALYRRGYAPWVLPSGNHAKGQPGFDGAAGFASEWAWMRSLLMEQGVPDSAILREDRATFTWENAQLSRRAADARGLKVRRGILCCRSYHARRALLYYQAAFPQTEWLVCPAGAPGLSRDDWYLTREGRDQVMGEVLRLGGQVREVFEQMLEENDEANR